MKEHMAAAFRYFGKLGYGEGVSGHISMRGTRVELSLDHVPRLFSCLISSRPRPQGSFLDEPLRQALLNHQGIGPCPR